MFSPRIARFRAAMILALAVLFSFDAALASFVCPHMSGCEHGMPASDDSNAGAENASGRNHAVLPCEPGQPIHTVRRQRDGMLCLAS